MKKMIAFALLAVGMLSGCTGYKYRLVCKRDGAVVYDSGLVDYVNRSERSDAWTVGFGGSYQPEPGSACQEYAEPTE